MNKIQEAVKELKKHVGKVAEVIGDHPWSGKIAQCMSAEYVSGVEKVGLRFKEFESGRTFYIFHEKHLNFLYKVIKKNKLLDKRGKTSYN